MTTASANHGHARDGSVDSTCATDKFTDRVTLSQRGRVALVRLSRPDKRNAIDGKMVEAIRSAFDRLPKETCAVVMHGEGDHFCAGADLGELAKHSALDLVRFSRSLHDGRLKGTLVGQHAEPVTYRKWWAREAKDLWVWP